MPESLGYFDMLRLNSGARVMLTRCLDNTMNVGSRMEGKLGLYLKVKRRKLFLIHLVSHLEAKNTNHVNHVNHVKRVNGNDCL